MQKSTQKYIAKIIYDLELSVNTIQDATENYLSYANKAIRRLKRFQKRVVEKL